jgi:hypothetical protein
MSSPSFPRAGEKKNTVKRTAGGKREDFISTPKP